MTRDPVCGVPIKEENAAWTSDYEDHTYFFCSERCKSLFDQDPQLYAKQHPPED